MTLSPFPFEFDEYDMPMNVRPIPPDIVPEVTSQYVAEIALKREILAGDYTYYAQAQPGTQAVQWETIEYLLPLMAARYPAHFTLEREGEAWTWSNHLLDSVTRFRLGETETLPPFPGEDPGGPPVQIARLPNWVAPGPPEQSITVEGPEPGQHSAPNTVFRTQGETTRPLTWLALQMQEDLLLMDGRQASTPMVAGNLCFGASWCLDDKIGESFLDIHYPIPQFAERIARAADLMIKRLKAGRPTGRMNWTIASTERLNLALKVYHEWLPSRRGITIQNAGERCYVRLERQTFSRLPVSGAILFTIHTTRTPVVEVVADPGRLRRSASVVKGMPRVTREYKGMTLFADALIDYLEARCREVDNLPATTAHRGR